MASNMRKEHTRLLVLLQMLVPAFGFSLSPLPLCRPAYASVYGARTSRVDTISTSSRLILPTSNAAVAGAEGVDVNEDNKAKKTIIVGSGPTGLFTSIMLARRGYGNIQVFDRLERPAAPDSPLWGDPYR
jgi:hypothetical protein